MTASDQTDSSLAGSSRTIPSTQDQGLQEITAAGTEARHGPTTRASSKAPVPSTSNPKGPKRSRVNTVGESQEGPTLEELDLRKRRIELKEIELREKLHEENQQAYEKLVIRNASQAAQGSGDEEISECPDIVRQTAALYPGVEPRFVMQIFNGKFDPANLLKLRAEARTSSDESTSELRPSDTGGLKIVHITPKIAQYGKDLYIFSQCFCRFFGIYHALFPMHVEVATAMIVFLGHIQKLAQLHTLEPVLNYAMGRMRIAIGLAHNAAEWSDEKAAW
ncbi:hypothetical protein F4804DRAFT_13520 [Jackrogersella minutella]|nr:hypothetical protein F4804DRAFT_13520 [Jackrogersella minutella]